MANPLNRGNKSGQQKWPTKSRTIFYNSMKAYQVTVCCEYCEFDVHVLSKDAKDARKKAREYSNEHPMNGKILKMIVEMNDEFPIFSC